MSVTQVLKNFQEYQGDLLKAEVDVIAHQCNCMSKGAAGLAAVIFENIPAAHTYNANPEPRQFGTWKLFDAPSQYPFRHVLNLYTQVYPGPPTWGMDSDASRIITFKNTISQFLMSNSGAVKSIAFPARIGSDLAGGNWFSYRSVLFDIATFFPDVQVHIVEKNF